MRPLQGLAGVLLHDKYSDTSTIDSDDLFEDHTHQHRRQTGCRLIEQEQGRVEHESPRHGYHLTLATAEVASAYLALIAQVGKEGIHFGLFRAHVPTTNEGAHIEIFFHGERRKHVLRLWDIAHPCLHNAVRPQVGHVAPVEPDRAVLRLQQPCERLHQG